jgi:cysteinyl-tRNA synthetase
MEFRMSKLRVFNTLTGKKELFVPLEGRTVRMYACGPTVYDLSHLGHARMAVVWDVVQRYLRFAGYDVTYVRNITDVDDKIINRAAALGISPEQVARENIFQFWADMRALNVASPDFEPRATEHIGGMISFIEQLIEHGHAYASEGDVYFDLLSFDGRGQLKKQNIEDQRTGDRSQVRDQEELKARKRHHADFALWKGVGEDEFGWESPWGRGRPGWHIECSAMIKHVLGETIDIHAGGEDLIFPHHENEIAQSESLHGHPLAKYWLHNSFVQVDAQKMGKSLNNFKTIQDLLQQYDGDTIRLYLLQTHYRSPIDFTAAGLDAARVALKRLERAVRFASETEIDATVLERAHARFTAAMDDDFNTAKAVAMLHSVADVVLKSKDAAERSTQANILRRFAAVLGLQLNDTSHIVSDKQSVEAIELLLQLRQHARQLGQQSGDFTMSDLIRDGLKAMGIKVMDSKDGTTWGTA